ncbi:MAG: transposase [Leptospiraceae bacterium]|nr:transposase [Leptospiraceae bacterium]
MWVFRGGRPDKPIIYYQYRTSRSAEFLKEFLNGYEGFIQADGLATYNAHLKETPEILLAGCLAHVRRKFENSFKASNEKSAEKILFTIKKLYDVEKKIRNHDYYRNGNFEEIVKIRQRIQASNGSSLQSNSYGIAESEEIQWTESRSELCSERMEKDYTLFGQW